MPMSYILVGGGGRKGMEEILHKEERKENSLHTANMHINKMSDISESNVSQSLIRNIILCCAIKQFRFTEQERINNL
jgi:hypothetical protein